MLLGIGFVAASLRRPTVESYAPTHAAQQPAGDTLVGPIRYTIDASSADEWRFFDFSRGSIVTEPGPMDWDLAFRRFHIIANGGPGFSGRGGIVNLGAVAFDSVTEAPLRGYVESTAGRDSANAATAHWYKYNLTSHLLRPKPDVWIVRTAEGSYARMRVVSYYCPGAKPGCVTFDYVYGPSSRIRFVR